jgi:hypothetical protein
MSNLDMLLLRGTSLADAEEGLNELRYTILTKGIPANSEGMVSAQSSVRSCTQHGASTSSQYDAHICLQHD